MNRRMSGDASLNAPLREEGEGEWQDWLVDDSASQENIARRPRGDRQPARRAAQALDVLNDRERRIFEARRLADDPMTLEALSDEFDISRERVRQIEVRAFEKVQSAVKAGVARIECRRGRRKSPAPPRRPGRAAFARAASRQRRVHEIASFRGDRFSWVRRA